MRPCFKKSLFLKNTLIISSVIFLVSNCSPISYHMEDCDPDEVYCSPEGNVDLLFKQPVDILLILDNTKKIRELYPSIHANLYSFLDCMEPLDWRLGIMVSGEIDGGYEIRNQEGSLINLEMDGEILPDQFLSPDREDYEKIFSDSVSLEESGCDFPPYCSDSKTPNSLKVLKSFMEDSTRGSNRFLRDNTPLTTIIISATHDGDKEIYSASSVLASVQRKNDYYKNGNHFMNITVTTEGTAYDCVTTPRDYVDKVVDVVSTGAALMPLIALDPITLIASFAIRIFSRLFYRKTASEKQLSQQPEKRVKIVDFAHQSGGPDPMDICRADYGKGLAAAIVHSVGMYERMPRECQSIQRGYGDNSF